MPSILAIDQSTSATKALLLTPAGEVIDRASLDHRQIYPRAGWVEHDAEEIWQNTLSAIRSLADRRPEAMADLLCVSLSNQRETIVVWDRRTGQPLRPAIVWQCHRGEAICEELKRRGHEPLVRRLTGLRIDPYFSGSKIAWLMREQPDLAARLRQGDALLGTIDAYLVFRLTGGAVFATDTTNASRTLLFDIEKLRWDESLCDLLGAPIGALPEVRDSGALFGMTDAGGRLPKPAPICGVMGDSQAALFAHRCFEEGQAKVTIGSGSSVLMNAGASLAKLDERAVRALAWSIRGAPTYGVEGIINYAAGTIAWLKDQLGLIQSATETESLARSVDDNGGVYLVPAFAGLSEPHWSANARGAIVGLSAHSCRAHVARAALESIGYQLADVLAAMPVLTKTTPGTLHADGGATTNAFLMQFIADLTGRDVAVSEAADFSPRGAAMMGALGLGVYQSLEDLSHLPQRVTMYQPMMDQTSRIRLLAGWRRAVEMVLAGARANE